MPNDIHRVNGSVYRQTAADKKQEEELWKLRKSTALMHLHIKPKSVGLTEEEKKKENCCARNILHLSA